MKKFLIFMILLIGAAIYLAHVNLQKSFKADWDLKEYLVSPPSVPVSRPIVLPHSPVRFGRGHLGGFEPPDPD